MYDLRHRTILGAGDGPHLLILGGVHGDEYEPILAARSLLGSMEPHKLRGRVTIVPCVNAPAFNVNSRCGPDRLDLARACPGDSNGSITQQIAHAVSALIRDADFLIDMHTGGRALRMAPLAGYVIHRDQEVRAQQHKMSVAFNLPIIWGTSPNHDGRTLSVARDANVPAIYVEFGGGGECSEDVIRAYIFGCLHVMELLGMVDRQEFQPAAQRFISDSRSGSGVLQVQHPSPGAGIFVPCAELGVPIDKGKPIGTVFDLSAARDIEVAAAEAGVLVALRALPGVQPGDALAAIAVSSGENQ